MLCCSYYPFSLPFLYGDNDVMIKLDRLNLTLNKFDACSVGGITSSFGTFRGLIYVRGTVIATVGSDLKISYESVIVSMVINAQPARLIVRDLLRVYINI